MDPKKYLALFLSESRDRLVEMEKVLVALDRDPASPAAGSVDEFFRAAHSIKGMAASMGFPSVTDLSHALEDLMQPVRNGVRPLTRPAVDVMLSAVDRLRELVDAVEEQDGQDNADARDLVASIRQLAVAGSGEAPPTTDAAKKGEKSGGARSGGKKKAATPVDADGGAARREEEPGADSGSGVTVQVEIAASSRTPAVRGYLVHKRLSELSHIVRMLPSLEEVKKGNFDRKLTIELADEPPDDAIRAKVTAIPEVVRVEIRRGGQAVETPEAAAAAATAAVLPKSDRVVRIPAPLLDSLIDGVGEILTLRHTFRSEAIRSESSRLLEAVGRLESIAQEMHRGALAARLSPIGTILERLPRAAREVGRLSGKEVEIDVSGNEIEIDRAILEEIQGPLVHVVRNAVDHGLETPEVRVQAGKPARGKLRIDITREKDFVSISIADDGKGMDPTRLRRLAYERGLIDEHRASEMDDREALRLICVPGFSTAERITEISGRGVGMDVVKTTVEGFGGEFEIESRIGLGTKILMRLPRTIALVQVLLAHTGEEMYAVPLNKILRSIEVSSADVKQVPRGSAIEVGNELVPMRPLAEALGRPVAARMTSDLRVRALVVEGRGRKAALAVDEIAGVQEVVVKPLGMPLRRIEGVAGITRVGGGRPVFLLDPQKLL